MGLSGSTKTILIINDLVILFIKVCHGTFFDRYPRDKRLFPTPECRERQRRAYLDPIPHRHKFTPEVMKKIALSGDQNKNVPLYSIHRTIQGEERQFTYIQSRYFYCHFYEVLAKRTEDYRRLCQMKADGINLLIMGYDAYPVTQDLYTHYCDESKPFGHELVLYTLLIIDNPREYPWNRYREANPDLYQNMLE